jgi:hypothetical protein
VLGAMAAEPTIRQRILDEIISTENFFVRNLKTLVSTVHTNACYRGSGKKGIKIVGWSNTWAAAQHVSCIPVPLASQSPCLMTKSR